MPVFGSLPALTSTDRCVTPESLLGDWSSGNRSEKKQARFVFEGTVLSHSGPGSGTVLAPAATPANSGRAAVIGPGIQINGDITGDENLIVEGKVKGKINLVAHQM